MFRAPVIPVDDIRAAAEALRGVAHRTPLHRSQTFSDWAGCDLFRKHENEQRPGSFKIRGASTKLQTLPTDQGAPGVTAPSAANPAPAVAFPARRAAVPATVFMP